MIEDWFGGCFGVDMRIARDWKWMTYRFQVALCYIIVNETLVEELPVFEDFPECQKILNDTLDKGKIFFPFIRSPKHE